MEWAVELISLISITRPNTLNADRPNVLLFLPPGPLFSSHRSGNSNGDGYAGNAEDAATSLSHIGGEDLPAQHVLASKTSSTVVTVNYQLGAGDSASKAGLISNRNQNSGTHGGQPAGASEGKIPFYKYPTPVHDTLAGFDWILQSLQPAQLSILGSHIGGSLALMLALTESESLHAVAALEPVCDWVELDEYCTIASDESESSSPKRGKWQRSVAPPDLVPLLQARERFFQTPERYFDAFASPILFLRSAGSYVPRKFPQYLSGPEYPIPVLKKLDNEDEKQFDYWDIYASYYEEETSPSSDPKADSEFVTDPADIHKGVRRRKSLSRWPPFGLDYGLDGPSSSGSGIGRLEMTLPWVRLFTRDEADEIPTIHHDRPRYARRNPPRRVLELQAGEMVSVMRRACFWGRETGFAEERVTSAFTRNEDWARDAGEWLEGLVESPSDR